MTFKLLATFFILPLVLLVSCSSGGSGKGGSPASQNSKRNKTWVADGNVWTIDRDPSTGITYLCGAFTSIGPHTGGGAVIDLANFSAMAGYPAVEGKVHCSAPDGSGGWYIGGEFTHVGGVPLRNLAHITAAKTIDSLWNPSPDQPVRAIAVNGSEIYVGGEFTEICSQSRNCLAAIDASGSLQSWNPDPDGMIRQIQVRNGIVYVTGAFSHVNGVSRFSVAAIDPNGLPTSWNPEPQGGEVYSIEMNSHSLYLVGGFTQIQGQARLQFAAVDFAGSILPWSPSVVGSVSSLACTDSLVILAGSVTSVNGTAREGIASVEATGTGTLVNWSPSLNGPIDDVVIVGDDVYAVGDFWQVNGTPRKMITGLNIQTGILNPLSLNPNFRVTHISAGNNQLYVGGDFMFIDGKTRRGIAALDANGVATEWNPVPANGLALGVKVSGEKIYVAGSFTEMNGQPRLRVACLDKAGQVSPFSPSSGINGYCVEVMGGKVYTGGQGAVRCYDEATGILEWQRAVGGSVTEMVGYQQALFIAGSFSSVNGVARIGVASLNASDGQLNAWDANLNGDAYGIDVASDGTLYIGGAFTSASGVGRNYLAAYSQSGVLANWNPHANNNVHSVSVWSQTVYIAGPFTEVGGFQRQGLTGVKRADGSPTTWNPGLVGGVMTICPAPGALLIGGSFSAAGPARRPYLATFTDFVADGG